MATYFVKYKEKLLKKQLNCGITNNGEYLYCLKWLNRAIN
jgi:hypothetical protein